MIGIDRKQRVASAKFNQAQSQRCTLTLIYTTLIWARLSFVSRPQNFCFLSLFRTFSVHYALHLKIDTCCFRSVPFIQYQLHFTFKPSIFPWPQSFTKVGGHDQFFNFGEESSSLPLHQLTHTLFAKETGQGNTLHWNELQQICRIPNVYYLHTGFYIHWIYCDGADWLIDWLTELIFNKL